VIFDPLTIKGVTFKNRIIRSSIGGRTAFYDGTVSSAWKNFEKRFAANGVAAIVSATIAVNEDRWAPLEYPRISSDRFIAPMRAAIKQVQAHDCRYLMQLGDGGSHQQMSLFPRAIGSRSSSRGLDLLYGYRSLSSEMSVQEISETIQEFADAGRRVRETGSDGIEITASKGYLLHQFLNPGVNRRKDGYGGSVDKRFRLLREVVAAVRASVGQDYLLGIRLSAEDFNHLPLFNVRLPIVFPLRHYWMGNTLKETLYYARELEKLGVDYLHITSGYGFINPKENPGRFPYPEVRLFASYTRHLSAKARIRSDILNVVPEWLGQLTIGHGWKLVPGENAEYAKKFKQVVGIPVVANGGFQDRELVEQVLGDGSCDLVSMARPLLANPDLIDTFRRGEKMPARPCTFCNRCAIRTAVFPLGCYDSSRFASAEEMEAQIMGWSARPDESLQEQKQAPAPSLGTVGD
jgi:2,4-dienoyl-CoA reductase-like NADH-dependent reductase (Old Yellow Enzyme family)